jgi:hypothetical protein
MGASYYYLVAGLPDIVLDEGKGVVPFVEAAEEIAEHLGPVDQELLRFIRYPFDNRNVAGVLSERDTAFDARGNFTAEELEEELKGPSALPGYMVQFLEDRADGREAHAGLTVEDQLHWLFYEEAFASGNAFIREWYTFDCDLRNILTAANLRSRSEQSGEDLRALLAASLVCRTDVSEQILRSSAADFGLGPVCPWADRALQYKRDDLTGSEKATDTFRWEVLDELTTFSYFGVETVLAFCEKLFMVERWLALDPEEGKARLKQLVEEAKAGQAAPAA